MRSLALLALAASTASALSLQLPWDRTAQKPIGGKVESEEMYLIELEGGVTRWIKEEEKWELRKVRHSNAHS